MDYVTVSSNDISILCAALRTCASDVYGGGAGRGVLVAIGVLAVVC
jgi:Mg2+/Co2+ transporter CorB